MTFVNRSGEEFRPVDPASIDYFDPARRDEINAGLHGLYYRNNTFPHLAANLQECLDGNADFAGLALDAEQAWNEEGWKVPHASKAAADRFCNKAREEITEIDEALEEYWENRNPQHLIEELGDFNYCVTAVASNAGLVVGDAVKTRLYDYLMGTKQYRDGAYVKPIWYDKAAQLSVKSDALTIGDIDELINAGFAPRFSTVMNLYEGDEEISPSEYMMQFLFYVSVLQNLSAKMFPTDQAMFHDTPYRLERQDMNAVLAETYLRIAAIAHYAGSSMAEVVAVNTRKIAGRIQNNQVDKDDNPRQNET
jgi:hypothetical protein